MLNKKQMTRLPISNYHFFLLNCLKFIKISSNLIAYSFVSSSKVCSSSTASVAEGDFRRIDLDFSLFLLKKQTNKQTNKTKVKQGKEKECSIAIILQKNYLCKKPRSVI